MKADTSSGENVLRQTTQPRGNRDTQKLRDLGSGGREDFWVNFSETKFLLGSLCAPMWADTGPVGPARGWRSRASVPLDSESRSRRGVVFHHEVRTILDPLARTEHRTHPEPPALVESINLHVWHSDVSTWQSSAECFFLFALSLPVLVHHECQRFHADEPFVLQGFRT